MKSVNVLANMLNIRKLPNINVDFKFNTLSITSKSNYSSFQSKMISFTVPNGVYRVESVYRFNLIVQILMPRLLNFVLDSQITVRHS